MTHTSRLASGSIVALITPFRDGCIDEAALQRIIEFQIKSGTDAVLPCGTTGESATLSHDEHRQVLESTLRIVRGRVPVIAGTGSNSTAEAIELTRHAADIGCDAALLIAPYYNRPTQPGLLRHFSEIADHVDIPQIMYNIPGRTGVNILPETVAALAEHPRIIGIKEACGNISQITQLMSLLHTRPALHKKEFSVVSGDDSLIFSILALGGAGVISAAANAIPKQIAALVHEFKAGRIEKSRRIQLEMLDLIEILFAETNPIPVKTVCSMMGLCRPDLRLPLCPMSKGNLEKMKVLLRKHHVTR